MDAFAIGQIHVNIMWDFILSALTINVVKKKNANPG